jgi:N-glycosylase/DNA lyase
MYFDSKDFDYKNIIKEVTIFIWQSRNNWRFIEIKVKRLSKLDEFFKRFEWKSKFYYENMLILRNDLAVALWKWKTNIVKNEWMKTINFAVKIFSYWARNIYWFIKFPTEISIPIDSRLINLFEKYREDYTDINKFYFDLSKKLDIPMLHLDAILWVNHENLI